MKRTLLLLLAIASLCSCYAPQHTTNSACSDPMFLSLQHKSLDSMSAREYEYFKQKDSECEQVSAMNNALESAAQSSSSFTIHTLVIGALALLALFFVVYSRG